MAKRQRAKEKVTRPASLLRLERNLGSQKRPQKRKGHPCGNRRPNRVKGSIGLDRGKGRGGSRAPRGEGKLRRKKDQQADRTLEGGYCSGAMTGWQP